LFDKPYKLLLLLPHLLNVKSLGNAIPTTTAHAFEFSQVTSLTVQVWVDRNLGASQVATSSTDPVSYGNSYQWGRLADAVVSIEVAAGLYTEN
jgi:hypothetical protein